MSPRSPRSRAQRHIALAAAALLTSALAVPLGAGAAVAAEPDLPGSDLYLNPFSTTLEAAQKLSGQARTDAQLLGSIPSADWFTKGTPAEVKAAVDKVVSAAANAGKMPVLVAYNLPFRDCAQYSAGGAQNTAAYQAWIDGVAAGIGNRPATVILEPDGLGIIPWNTDGNGNLEWCQPAELNPATAADERYVQMNYAVDKLGALGATSVYLDGTHSGWLGVADISQRLIRGGVERADGFYLNASNYVETERLQKFGTWISQCIHLSQNSWWQAPWCSSQYYPANPNDFSTWGLTDAEYDKAYADTGLTRDPAAMAHFVIDTSRNGQGPWAAPDGHGLSDPEDWCNPPDRGLGALPTTSTGSPLVDAYLWIKVPGESDGKCFRGTAGPLDPARGIEDPAAGQWFTQQARELIALAAPGLAALDCHVDWKANGEGKAFSAQVRLDGAPAGTWTLTFAVPEGQTVTKVTHGTVVQKHGVVTVTGTAKGKGNAPDTVVHAKGSPSAPWQFHLDGRACTS